MYAFIFYQDLWELRLFILLKLHERKKLLSAINKDNFVSNKIINGSVKHDIYLLFFEENLEIFKYKTILHDNARIHHSKLLKE